MASLDLVTYPASPTPGPAVLVLPGGGYRGHAPHEGEPIARWLNSIGLHAAVLRYTVGDEAWPGALLDARAALSALRDGETDLQVTRGRLGVLGFSAGGHLAAMLATDDADVPQTPRWSYDRRPDAAVLCYAVTDLRATLNGRIPNLHVNSARGLLGEDADEDLLAVLSPATRITAPEEGEDVPPIFCWSTSDDEGVPVLHSLEMMTALAVAGVPFEAHVFPYGQHGLGLADDEPHVAQWTRLCRNWFAELGWLGADEDTW